MEQRTHLAIDPELVGRTTSIAEGTATADLMTTPRMGADERGLVHGSFAFGLADYAAMVAVNDPNVVLGGVECRFLAPVRVGERMVAEATVEGASGKKRTVSVAVMVDDRRVFEGTFTCFVMPTHVLDD